MFASADTFQGWSGSSIPFFGWGPPSTAEPAGYPRGGSIALSRPAGMIQARVITGNIIKAVRLPGVDFHKTTERIIQGIRKGMISFSMAHPEISRGKRQPDISRRKERPFIVKGQAGNVDISIDSGIIDKSDKKGRAE
jgi:hypothetical protein